MKTLLFAIPLLLFSCSKQKTVSSIDAEKLNTNSVKPNPAFEIDTNNLDDMPLVKNFTKSGKKSLKFHGKLTDIYRYVMLYDEQNPAIKSRFVQLGFKKITTKILIESPRKDTLYHFPIKPNSESPYKLGATHTFYATLLHRR